MSKIRRMIVVACALLAVVIGCVSIGGRQCAGAQDGDYTSATSVASKPEAPSGYAYINDQSYVVYEIASGGEYYFEDGVLEPRCCISGEQYNYYWNK